MNVTTTAATAIIVLGAASILILEMELAIVAMAATSHHANMTQAIAVKTQSYVNATSKPGKRGSI